jgi:hypothetical protein
MVTICYHDIKVGRLNGEPLNFGQC